MNIADNGVGIPAKKIIIKCQFRSGNCMALTAGLFVFGRKSMLSSMASLIWDLSLEQSMPAEEKARSGSMLAGGIVSRKLSAFSV